LRWLHVVAAMVAVVLLGLAARPEKHIYDMPLTEDGYYALSVARNAAAGLGPTIDGVVLSNGFQPLFTLFQAGAFYAAQGDEVLAMRLVIALGWLFHAAGAVLIALLARDAWPARYGSAEISRRIALAAFLYLASPLMLNHAYNGLETGCVMFLYAAAARWMQTSRDRSWLGLAGFGIIIGLLVLARIDAAFVAVMLGLNELRRAWRNGFSHMILRGAVIGLAALAISSPWWAYNTIVFASPMPTSGTAQQEWGLEWLRLEHAEWALRLVLMPWLFAGAYESSVSIDLPIPYGPAGYMTFTAMGFIRSLILLIFVIAILVWAFRRGPRRDLQEATDDSWLLSIRTLEFAACFAIAYVALIAYYTLSFVAYWFYYRYFAPLALFAFAIVPVMLGRWTARRDRARLVGRLALLLAVQIVVLAALAMFGRGLGGNTVYHDQVALVREHVPDGDLVAAGQSGTLGYFRSRVVNTDGKVNRDALVYQTHMWDYLREREIRWFVDWPFYVNKYLGVPLDSATDLPATEGNGWRLVAERNYFYLYEYVGTAGR
jgi:hypothetical protein